MLLLKYLLYFIYLFHQQIYIEYLLTSTYYSSSQPTVPNTQIPWYKVYIVEGNKGTNFTSFSDKFYEIIKGWCSLRIDRAEWFFEGRSCRQALTETVALSWVLHDVREWGSEEKGWGQASMQTKRTTSACGRNCMNTEVPEDENWRKVVKEGIERVGYCSHGKGNWLLFQVWWENSEKFSVGSDRLSVFKHCSGCL